jgi:hypothetical protein
MSSGDRLAYLSSMELQGGMSMNPSKLLVTLFTLQLSALGCAASRPEGRADAPGLIAMGPMTGPAPSRTPSPLLEERVPDEVLHDPAARFALTERLRTQMVARTRGYSDSHYWTEARPRLRRQIERAGLPRADVELLLSEVDQSREPGR